MDYWGEIQEVHKDFGEVVESEGFEKFLKDNPDYKAIADKAGSDLNSKTAIKVVDAYKESIAGKKVDEIDKKAEKEKKEKDDLHSSTSKAGKPKPAVDETEDTVQAGWDAEKIEDV